MIRPATRSLKSMLVTRMRTTKRRLRRRGSRLLRAAGRLLHVGCLNAAELRHLGAVLKKMMMVRPLMTNLEACSCIGGGRRSMASGDGGHRAFRVVLLFCYAGTLLLSFSEHHSLIERGIEQNRLFC